MAEEDKVKTGIPGMDEMIEGGFEPRSVVIVAGGPGSGKTTFAMQFLFQGAEKFKEPGLYITFEEQKGMLFKHMKRMGWDFDKLEKDKMISVLEYPPHEVHRFITEGNIIEDIIRENGVQRVVIDSITSLVMLHEDEYKRRMAFLKTMESLRKWGCTCLLTSEAVTSRDGEVKPRFGVEYLADGLIVIHGIRQGDVMQLALEVTKMRGIAHERRMVPMKITDRGITLYPGQPVLGKR
ncbi:MAG: AAA family ATPase [Candidatus Micrarchaeota archaeon]|nr:AAA family ATPase [Candidatus Micrarchaeota archaeon]